MSESRRDEVPQRIDTKATLNNFSQQLLELKLYSKNRVLVADDEEFCQASMKAIL